MPMTQFAPNLFQSRKGIFAGLKALVPEPIKKIKRTAKQWVRLFLQCLLAPTQQGPFPLISLKSHVFFARIWSKYRSVDDYFGRSIFFQSLDDRFSLQGERPSQSRFYAYGMNRLLNKEQRVLDIGCNVGFFDIFVSKYVRWVDAFDIDPLVIEIGQSVAQFLGCENLTLRKADFRLQLIEQKYDVVFCLAVHRWVGLPFVAFVRKVRGCLVNGGLLFFESNNYDIYGQEFEEEVKFLLRNGFSIVDQGFTQFETRRKHLCLRLNRQPSRSGSQEPAEPNQT